MSVTCDKRKHNMMVWFKLNSIFSNMPMFIAENCKNSDSYPQWGKTVCSLLIHSLSSPGWEISLLTNCMDTWVLHVYIMGFSSACGFLFVFSLNILPLKYFFCACKRCVTNTVTPAYTHTWLSSLLQSTSMCFRVTDIHTWHHHQDWPMR